MGDIIENRMCAKLVNLAKEFFKDPKNIEALNKYRAAKCNGQAAQKNCNTRREKNEQKNPGHF